MPDSLNVIALISGGKDSLFSLLHCIQNGHKIIALANLYPPINNISPEDVEGEDLNSFMYQTVGHSIIPLYAEALRLPLFRREITGSALNTGRYYGYTPSQNAQGLVYDETEDLVPLLRQVLTKHPTANAISTGAIQSTYQRTRIESIAMRLGLTPLAYLWQYPVLPSPVHPRTGQKIRDDSTTGLLDDMAASGCESRIIKIASGGIRESLLWSDVTDAKTRTQLVAGLRRYFSDNELGLRGAVVGEGGEFESLALSGPKRVWKGGTIDIDKGHIETFNGDGGTSYVRLKGAKVVASGATKSNASDETEIGLVRIPGLLDHQFGALQSIINIPLSQDRSNEVKTHATASVLNDSLTKRPLNTLPKLSYSISGHTIQISNMSHLDSTPASPTMLQASEQMRRIASALPALLFDISEKHDVVPRLTTSAIVSTVLLLRNMADFVSINPIYGAIFEAGVPNPAARVTVAAPLPDGIDVMVSFVLDLGPIEHRQGLHVQSRSYWAPANIGPYSQAINVPLLGRVDNDSERALIEIVHVAGQIPLVPACMDLLEASFAQQAVLSLQHLWRIGQETKVDHWTAVVAFVPRETDTVALKSKIEILARMWTKVYDDARSYAFQDEDLKEDGNEVEIDIWDIQNNRSSQFQQSERRFERQQHLHQIPSVYYDYMTAMLALHLPPFIAAEVTSLPRNAPIEWWSTGVTQMLADRDCAMAFSVSVKGNWSITTVYPDTFNPAKWSKFVVYLVPTARTSNQNPPDCSTHDSLTEVLRTHVGENIADIRLANSMAIVATHVAEGWKDLVFDSGDRMLQDTGYVYSNERPKISDLAITILSYSLWGHAGQTSLGLQTIEQPPIHMLDVALLLRIDSS